MVERAAATTLATSRVAETIPYHEPTPEHDHCLESYKVTAEPHLLRFPTFLQGTLRVTQTVIL